MTQESEPGIDLAAERLGARVIWANDEFFAEKENLLKASRPVFIDDKYTDRGKWMDGWETRRRRTPGHDACIIRLGLPGLIREVIVDTAFFRGNFPEACAIDGAVIETEEWAEFTPDGISLPGDGNGSWIEILPRTPLAGDSPNRFSLDAPWRFTHLRLRIFPDGGVARFRAYGLAVPDRRLGEDLAGRLDLAAMTNGGEVIACSDMFFSNRNNLIRPGPSLNMGDGWETRRRRGPGHDWAIVSLAAEGEVRAILLDTTHFKGNAPGSAWLEGVRAPGGTVEQLERAAWKPLLETVPLEPNQEHAWSAELKDPGAITHVRLSIAPDGGVARLRLFGEPSASGRESVALRWLNTLPPGTLENRLERCCGAPGWAQRAASSRPFDERKSLDAAMAAAFAALTREELLEAVKRHPRLGESAAAAPVSDEERRWSAGEQAALAASATGPLASLNAAYEKKFGWVFLLCASGLDESAVIAALEKRTGNDPETELAVAGAELSAIARLRIEKLLGLGPGEEERGR